MAMIQLIRSATVKITIQDVTFLVDPMLGPMGSFESYGGIQKNPIVDLPCSKKEILQGVDAVLVSHLHKDHFDDVAKKSLPKNTPIFCQPTDKESIDSLGFSEVTAIEKEAFFKGISIRRTDGNHGRGAIEKLMGRVSGFLLSQTDTPSIYLVGDCILNHPVQETIKTQQPDIIVTNSGGAFIPGYDENLILLDEQETIQLAQLAPKAKIVAVHLEALDHCIVSRASLKRAILQSDIDPDQIRIPLNGETLVF